MEMRLPNWVRLIVTVSVLMKLGFGLTLLYDPARIADLWPWPLPPLTARLLGASTLVSIPMALLAVGINRYAVAMIPFVMMLLYRVLQLTAGLIHADRFAGGSMTTLNYFGGGLLMLIVFGYSIWAGETQRLAPASPKAPMATPLPWAPALGLRVALQILAAIYVVLGLVFLIRGGAAAPLWIDAQGLTPLTARLFASPLIGLGVGLFLVSRAHDWRRVFVPAVGMVTIGFTGTLAMVLEQANFLPGSVLAWLVAATPPTLLVVGALILLLRPKP